MTSVEVPDTSVALLITVVVSMFVLGWGAGKKGNLIEKITAIGIRYDFGEAHELLGTRLRDVELKRDRDDACHETEDDSCERFDAGATLVTLPLTGGPRRSRG